MRLSDQKINPSLKNQIVKTLAQTIADLKTQKEAQAYLQDFLTESELETFSKRLAIAYWLKRERSYENIKQNLKVSSATIAAVQSMVGSKGFRLALKKIEAEEWSSVWAEKIKKFIK